MDRPRSFFAQPNDLSQVLIMIPICDEPRHLSQTSVRSSLPCIFVAKHSAPSIWISTQQSVQKVTWKQGRKNRIEPICPQQTFKMGSRDAPKITANLVPDPQVSFLLIPWSLRVPPKVPKWSPAMPNSRNQAFQMTAFGNCNGVKEVGGRGRSP